MSYLLELLSMKRFISMLWINYLIHRIYLALVSIVVEIILIKLYDKIKFSGVSDDRIN